MTYSPKKISVLKEGSEVGYYDADFVVLALENLNYKENSMIAVSIHVY